MKKNGSPLLTALTNLNGLSKEDKDPLLLSAVKATIESGCDLDLVDKKRSWSALHYLSMMPNHWLAMTKLLQAGATPDTREKRGATPLGFAVFHGNDNAVELLLEYGADPTLEDDEGVSAYSLSLGEQYKDQVPLFDATIKSLASAKAEFDRKGLNTSLPEAKHTSSKKKGGHI